VASIPRSVEEDRRLKALGCAIRDIRKAQNVSQEALAHISGIDRSHTGKIERGERNVTALNLLRIADALKVAPSELFARAGL
jgi:transcriptional regulator with XRE-family HTH domain